MTMGKVLLITGVLFCASFNANTASLSALSTYSTIQSASNSVVNSDTILVAPEGVEASQSTGKLRTCLYGYSGKAECEIEV